LNNKDSFRKFDAKFDEGIFLSYSFTSKAYKVYNHRTLVVKESIHVVFDKSNPFYLQKVKKVEKVGVDIILDRLTLNERGHL
jgi:hypothetical protein